MAVHAAAADVEAVRQHVADAAAIDAQHTLVLQAQAILTSLQGKTADGVERATQAAKIATERSSIMRAQLGMARMLLLHGATEPQARHQGVELLTNLARYGRDVDANIQMAAEIAPKGSQAQFQYLSAAFAAKPTDPRPMQQLLAIYREQSWPIGVATLAQHIRESTESSELRFMSDLLGLAAALYLGHTPWASLVAPTDAQIEQAIAASVEHGTLARCTLASLLIDLGRHASAERVLAEVAPTLATTEERAHHAFMLGRLQQSRDDFPGAIGHYRRAFELWPEHLDAACNFVDLSLDQQDLRLTQPTGELLRAASFPRHPSPPWPGPISDIGPGSVLGGRSGRCTRIICCTAKMTRIA